jgi:hypothetical protein
LRLERDASSLPPELEQSGVDLEAIESIDHVVLPEPNRIGGDAGVSTRRSQHPQESLRRPSGILQAMRGLRA